MNWFGTIRDRFNNSPAEIHGRWVCEAGNTKCEIDLRSSPGDPLILSIDVLEAVDDQIRSAIFGQQRCDFLVIGSDSGHPYLILIEVKGGVRPRASRIRRAKSQLANSQGIATTMLENCQVPLPAPTILRVVVTRRIPASTMTRWRAQQDSDVLFRELTLVFSGDDIWQEILGA